MPEFYTRHNIHRLDYGAPEMYGTQPLDYPLDTRFSRILRARYLASFILLELRPHLQDVRHEGLYDYIDELIGQLNNVLWNQDQSNTISEIILNVDEELDLIYDSMNDRPEDQENQGVFFDQISNILQMIQEYDYTI